MAAEKTAFVFPGQGSQRVGMGKLMADAFPAAGEVFAEADETLGFALSRLCWQGPEEELQLTVNTQPAILATSVAIHRVVAQEGGRAEVVAGHSLGEYSALVAAGSLELRDALRLVRRRAELMQEAVPVGEGAMAAIVGVEPGLVEEVAAEVARATGEVCVVANLNAPQQTVIAGHRQAVERAMTLTQERGAKRAVLLPVSAPFHSPLMAPAREGMEPVLASTHFEMPDPPVVCNVDARPVTKGAEARDALVRQIDQPVRWVESVRWTAEEADVSTFVELGPGGVLSGLIRRIVPAATRLSVAEPKDLDKVLEHVEG